MNMATLNPLDEGVIVAAGETGAIVNVVISMNPVPTRYSAFPTGSAEWLFDNFGLNESGIAVRKTIARKREPAG